MSEPRPVETLAKTFAAFASEGAFEVAAQSADWFSSRRDAGAMVERYTSAAVWVFMQGSAAFHAMTQPDPKAVMKAYQTDRLARFAGVAPNQKDQDIWRMLQEDAEAFARIMMSPQIQSSDQPLGLIADGWFRERSGGALTTILPVPSATRLATMTSQLYSGVNQLLSGVRGG